MAGTGAEAGIVSGRAAVARGAALALLLLAAARPFTPKDLIMLDRVADPHLSPDGTQVAYDVRSTDFAANKGTHAIWLAATDGHTPPHKLTAPGTSPHWLPDGKTLYFLNAGQIWRIAAAGGPPAQVTHTPIDIDGFRIAPDGHTIVAAMAVFPDCESPLCTKSRLDAKAKNKASGTLYTRLFVRHWDEWADGRRNHLFALAADGSGQPTPLMRGFDGDSPSKPFGGEEDYAIAPDSRSVVFSARQAGRTEERSTNFDLFQVPIDGSAPPQNLTAANKAWDGAPLFSPDGRTLAYKAMKRPGFEADRFGIMLRDMASGTAREIDPKWDRSADAMRWSADGASLYVTAEDMGHVGLFKIDTATGDATKLIAKGTVADLDAAGHTVVVGWNSLAGPTALYRLDGTAMAKLTDADDKALEGVAFSPYEQFSFRGWNNEPVHGTVLKPYGFQAGHTYPVAFLVHGGPQGSFGDGWSYRWNPQTYAGAGYAVVMVDFHGSTGYGQAFTDSISGHWGDRPLEDLQKGWNAALNRYPFLDRNRACALGASYGGFMVYWIAGVWNAPWKCLVDHDGVFDNRMMGYSTEELWFSEWENGHATPYENPGAYERFNPITRVKDWRVPMLVVHSAHDYRIPQEQGLAAFTALQRRDIPSAFLTFPDENHWILKPQNSLEWHETVLDWLARWIGPDANKEKH